MERARGAPRAWESTSSAVTTPSSARTSITRSSRPGTSPHPPQVGQHGGVPVLYLRDDAPAGLRPAQRSRILGRQRAVGIAIRMSRELGRPRLVHFAGLALLGGRPAVLDRRLRLLQPRRRSVAGARGRRHTAGDLRGHTRLLLWDSAWAKTSALSAPNLGGFTAGVAIMYATALLVSV
jgi:hypothetical protein